MRRPVLLAIWALATVALAGATAYVVAITVPTASEPDFHEWMHARLGITPTQEAVLAPLEWEFTRDRERLVREMREAGHDLAEAVRRGDPEAPEIQAALERLNAGRAELQRRTLEHFFVMKEELDPGQAVKLLKWTHERLIPE